MQRRSPVLHADYSDPDAIRVGDTYYMPSSSFVNTPGLPLPTWKDMVNWELVGHALPNRTPAERFAAPCHGEGVWAPCLRYHDGKFWIFYPDPDLGIFVITAKRFDGPWSAPKLLHGKSMIAPTPLWDDDGKAYLLHAWAKSRPRSINGPYEVRTMLEQGATAVNGPHQGAWVRAQNGSDWFLHFQDKKAYGRVVHLQPMRWVDGWPVIGQDSPRAGTGQPFLTHAKPVAGSPVKAPPTSDEVNGPALGLQWQWNANNEARWFSLTARAGKLRLHTQAAPKAAGFVRAAPNIVAQKLPAPAFVVNTHVTLNGAADGDRADLIINAMQYAWLGLRKTGGVTDLVYTTCTPAVMRCTEVSKVVLPSAPTSLYLRMKVSMSAADGAVASFSYSTDNVKFTPAGEPLGVSKGRWVGAQIGLFSIGDKAAPASSLDVDYFRLTAP